MPVALHSSLDGGPVSLDILSGLRQELAFSVGEYRGRVERVREAMRAARVDVLLVKEPSNVLYLCGLQSFSMYGGECIILPLDGEPTLVVHPPEAGTALLHTWIDDVHTYDASVTHEQYLASLLRDKGLDKAGIAIEKQSIGVTVVFQDSLAAQMSGLGFADGSALVLSARTLKSSAEIAHLRKAAAITDLGSAAAIEAAGEGKTDNDIAAAASFALIQGGSEYMALSPIVTSGRRSGILHSTHKRVPLCKGDSILIEVGASYQRYTAPTMRTISIGDPDAGVIRMAGACLSALDKVIEAIRPGITSDEVARAGWEGMDLAGPGLVFHGVFGYAVGCNFPPTWADGTAIITLGDYTVLQPGMVFHHPVAFRRLGEYGVAFSETSVVTEDGCEVLTSTERRLFIR